MELKRCSRKSCDHGGKPLPLINFYRTKDGKRKPECKDCRQRSTAEWRKKNKQQHRAYSKHWVQKYPERALAARLRIKYGMSLEQYHALKKQQNSCCAICTIPENETKRGLFVDHDHITGKIRGLLCSECNLAIGKMFDCPAICHLALLYLSRL